MNTPLREDIGSCLKEKITKNIKKDLFTGCSLGYAGCEKSYIYKEIYSYGYLGKKPSLELVDSKSVFDLASLTKPLVTSLAILVLLKENKLSLGDSLTKFFDLAKPRFEDIKILHLLEHSSGLPAHREYFRELITLPDEKRETILIQRILNEELLYLPGESEVYSDLGYILLGKIVEKVSGEELDTFWEKKIIGPTGLENDLFFNRNGKHYDRDFCSTGYCLWSKKELYGLVNDDNCRSIGGVAGHAGLFGTAKALLDFCCIMLEIFYGSYSHPNLSFGPVRQRMVDKKGRWILGFDTPSANNSSSGSYFSDQTLGHLGFTGTSFWLDLKQRLVIVLLTNRVLYGDNIPDMQKFRPLIHNIIMERLTGSIKDTPC